MDQKMGHLLEGLMVAYLHEVEGLSLEESANRLGINSIPTASRRLADARSSKLVHSVINEPLCEDKLKVGFRDCFRYSRVEKLIHERFKALGVNLREVHVIIGDINPWKEEKDTAKNGFARISRLGNFAAGVVGRRIRALLESNKEKKIRIGINLGFTIHTLARRIGEYCRLEENEFSRIEINPLCSSYWIDPSEDDLLVRDLWESAPSYNAYLMAHGLCGNPNITSHKSPSCQVRRIRLPLQTPELDDTLTKGTEWKKIVKAMYGVDPSYKIIYGEERPINPEQNDVETYIKKRTQAYWDCSNDMTKKAAFRKDYGELLDHDFILTSLSALSESSTIVRARKDQDIARLIEGKELIGDIANHLFCAKGIINRSDDPVGRFNKRLIGLWPEDLREIAEIHAEKHIRSLELEQEQGGVYLMAAGQDKAKALITILEKEKVANELFIDANCAYAMLKELMKGVSETKLRDLFKLRKDIDRLIKRFSDE